MRLQVLLPAFAVACSMPSVNAWGAAGHEIIATIAQMYLHPSVLPKLCDILDFTSTNPNEPQCHLAPIAAWADRIRWKERWSAPLHYVGGVGDHPSETCLFPGPNGWAGHKDMNVLGALRNDTGILEEWEGGDDERSNSALKFLVHFLGDMHMPLHLTGRDRGGNSVQVLFDGRHTNLHSLWDGLLIAKAIRSTPYNYTRPLPIPTIEFNLRGAIYDPYIRRIVWQGLMHTWKDETVSWLECPSSSSSSKLWTAALPAPLSKLLNAFNTAGNNVAGETDDDTFCPYHWAQPIHALNCDLVWPPALDLPPYSHSSLSESEGAHDHDHSASVEEELRAFDAQGRFTGGRGGGGPYLELDTPEYAGVITDQMIIEKLLAQGGIRLAALLNYLFADEDGMTIRDVRL